VQSGAQEIVLVGQESLRHVVPILQEASQVVTHFFDSRQAGKYIREVLLKSEPDSYIVYAKGSQNTIYLEEGIKEILFDRRECVKLCRQSDSWMSLKEDFYDHVLEDKPKQL